MTKKTLSLGQSRGFSFAQGRAQIARWASLWNALSVESWMRPERRGVFPRRKPRLPDQPDHRRIGCFTMPMNNALRLEWQKAGYRTDMGSSAVVPPPPKDFIRVYHLTSAKFAMSDIENCRMKVAKFSDLNDPFELMALNLRERHVRKVVRNFKNEQNNHTGVLCFSADWTNPVLWSHYAAKHHGVCLGFDLMRDCAQQVKYRDKRILTSFGEEEDPLTLDKNLQSLLLRTKYRHWQYEKELRVIVPLEETDKDGELHFRPFDPSLRLAEVILGPQCNLSLRTVRQRTQRRHTDVAIFKARLAFKFFKVVPDERTVP